MASVKKAAEIEFEPKTAAAESVWKTEIIEKTATAVETETATGEEAEKGNVIVLSSPYLFEGNEYSEVDLSGIEKLTIQDAVDAQKELFGQQEVATAVVSETTTAFARAIASKATGLPIEFFKLMPRKINRKVTAAVREYMNTETKTEDHVMELEEPYWFNGEEYTKIDLNGIDNLNSMNESEAENRMTRAGYVITTTQMNYLYSCIIASMATGLPEAFFTGLPIQETLKLKAAVNDPAFFE